MTALLHVHVTARREAWRALAQRARRPESALRRVKSIEGELAKLRFAFPGAGARIFRCASDAPGEGTIDLFGKPNQEALSKRAIGGAYRPGRGRQTFKGLKWCLENCMTEDEGEFTEKFA